MNWNQYLPTEDAEHAVVAEWLELRKVAYFHVPNGGLRNKKEAAKFRRLGVKPGVPDIIIVDRPPLAPMMPGVALELKRRKGGRVSGKQTEWLRTFSERGWATQVCHGAKDAIEYLEGLGYGKGRFLR